MSQAEARSWWADVQHLRPDAPAVAEVVEAPVELFVDESRDELAQRRRGRITGRPLEPRGDDDRRRAARAEAAGFAEALSLDAEDFTRARDRDREDERHDDDDRRTIHITGMPDAPPVRRLYEVQERRERSPRSVPVGARPDRIALYAVALGIFLVLLAAVSSSADAAVLIVR